MLTDKEYLDPQGIYGWSKAELAEFKAMQNEDKKWSDTQKAKAYKAEVRTAMSSKQAASELSPTVKKEETLEEKRAAEKEDRQRRLAHARSLPNEAPSGKRKKSGGANQGKDMMTGANAWVNR